MKKNRLKFKKNRPVRFWFYKHETKKIEWNQIQTEKKPSQTEKIKPKPKQPSQTRMNRFLS